MKFSSTLRRTILKKEDASCGRLLCAGIFLFVLNTFVSGTPGNVLKIISRISQPYNVNSGFFNLLDITIHNARCDLINRTVRESICDTNWDAYGVNGTDTLNRSCCGEPWNFMERGHLCRIYYFPILIQTTTKRGNGNIPSRFFRWVCH